MKVGIAVGRSTHTIVTTSDEKREYIANSQDGADALLLLLQNWGVLQIILAGNRRWATPLAYYLEKKNIEVFYFNIKTERGARGRRGDVATLLAKILNAGIKGRPFFRSFSTEIKTEDKEIHPNIRLSHEYLEASNMVRGLKHRLLDCLALLFPEVAPAKTKDKKVGKEFITLPIPQPQPPDIFGKKMRPVLENPDPLAIIQTKDEIPAAVKTLAATSLGRFVPPDIRTKEMENLKALLTHYDQWLNTKEEKIAELKKKAENYLLYQDFNKGDLIAVIFGLLCWRKWDNWRELRRYCGLDVSRIDSTGKPRISRVRPETRQYLYLLMLKTGKGKEVLEGVHGNRVKRIEKMLKYLWKTHLKNPMMVETPPPL